MITSRPFKSFVAQTDAINALPSTVAVVGAFPLTTVYTGEAFVAYTLSIQTTASVVAVVDAS